MAFWDFHLPDGTQVRTCPASLGYSFAAGTTDGPGAFDFTQGDSGKPSANPLWKLVSGLLRTPTRKQRECQVPKPILLDVGEMELPYPWSPNIVDIQTLRVGQLVMLVVSPEVTTMAGRRWREATAEAAKGIVDDPIVVLGGPANTYSVSSLMAPWFRIELRSFISCRPYSLVGLSSSCLTVNPTALRHDTGRVRCPALRRRFYLFRPSHAIGLCEPDHQQPPPLGPERHDPTGPGPIPPG